MIHSGRWTRASLMALFACALMLSPLISRAAENPLLSSLYDFRISNFEALNAYYQFSVNGSTETLNDIVASINASNAEMNSISEKASGLLNDDQVARLNQDFDKFKDLMRQNINDVRQNGYPDLRLVSDMANQAVTLSRTSAEMYDIVRTSESVTTDKRVEAARAAAVLMAQMMSKYSARSTSSVSQTFQGADTEEPLDEQAKQFDALMSEVTAGHPSGELHQTLSSVASKWGFIRSSYVNYNENNVSFVIDRYSKGILEELNQAIELMIGNDRAAATANASAG
ncbi:hypothetical protein RE428_22150 [Marinobacter nanhaiticus D15-8W]|uniref:Uncharacterized protein n=1 Tax=Marinobacter nanhaiticus D15-8W TaxID=626887 RepID=N6WYF1_9GAMM|nr:hypothetical protein [Marinobacter nanhaiticus]ENO13823.1 hypothetical protein J057_20545 [Marinobacter nanhaiticus D15-8W]BES71197.1 hypothetical protein RE428_22150 [Marinobacter nanhaiticus D15-8W]